MPLYLIHGFRWTRAQIRIFIILNNIEDASADYIQSPATVQALRAALLERYPALHLDKVCPNLTFVEQHDPDDLRTGAQPFAFVADTVREAPVAKDGGITGINSNNHHVVAAGGGNGNGDRGLISGISTNELFGQGLSMDVGVAMGRGGGIGGEAWDAMADLRDEIAQDESVGWFAVWNGDVERRDLGGEEEEDEDEEEETEEEEEEEETPRRRLQSAVHASNMPKTNKSVFTNGIALPPPVGGNISSGSSAASSSQVRFNKTIHA